ncbi:hypothetical protein CEXT_407261 [Caerostris extrusa]|uniref:Uncharacterized protein n=1 Tax=Caerostris extrusa TaxID=172846 RepID=A0AAV4NKE6_CAEEX|nr:hypothetical protein CEXT_407261 [Caerostris extrusa]
MGTSMVPFLSREKFCGEFVTVEWPFNIKRSVKILGCSLFHRNKFPTKLFPEIRTFPRKKKKSSHKSSDYPQQLIRRHFRLQRRCYAAETSPTTKPLQKMKYVSTLVVPHGWIPGSCHVTSLFNHQPTTSSYGIVHEKGEKIRVTYIFFALLLRRWIYLVWAANKLWCSTERDVARVAFLREAV